MSIKKLLKSRRLNGRAIALWAAAFAVVLVLALGLDGLAVDSDQIFPVYFTEVLSSNSSFPNSQGRCCDYLEIYNSADYAVDLSGFQMGDIAGKSRYAFPKDTVLGPGEYLVIYCDKSAEEEWYAPFEISRAGGESFYLIARNGAVVDSVTTLALDVDEVMLLSGGSWARSRIASPGGGDIGSGETGADIYNPEVSPVRISEYSGADGGYLHQYDIATDWVELHNGSDSNVDISGFTLSDNAGNDKFAFPQGTVIPAGGYLVVNCSNRVIDANVAPFGLSQQLAEVLVLKDSLGRIIHIVNTVPTESGSVILTSDGKWSACANVSPGYPNTDAGAADFLRTIGAEKGSIRISEVMAAEQLVLPDCFGCFSDWVELENTADHPIDLSGWALSDDPSEPRKWIIRDLTLESGERAIIYCSGRGVTEQGQLHADFSLSAGGESLTLSAYSGHVVDSVNFPASDAHTSLVLDGEGKVTVSQYPTPGFANDMEGYEAFLDTQLPTGPLAIWEVMTANNSYIPQRLGECYDWVELRNISGETIDLSGYCISDDPQVPDMHRLQNVMLAPGESIVVILSSEAGVALNGYDQALFGLDAKSDQLFLFGPQGRLLDFVYLKDIPVGYSYGRTEGKGGFAYMEPTPKNPNIAGYRLISGAILASWDPGVYVQEEGCVLTLEATGDIYYTTDGSEPTTRSKAYDGAIQIKETTVIRAMAREEGKVPSEIYTVTFIVGQHHDLPVVSLVTDPDHLWGPNGMYKNGDISVKEIREPAHLSYTGEDGSFAINCMTNMHGVSTVTAFNKKTFAVRFYDWLDGPLHYDVFEDGEVTDFRSLIIRTSHESTVSTQMHDAFISHVASQVSDSVLTQKYKYVVLYLNGEYWGIYAIRERHSPEHYASYRQVPPETVEVVRYMIDEYNDLNKLYQFLEYNNLRSEKEYAYACSVLDVESFADWLIFETYVDDIDIFENVRYYRSSVDGLWRMGLADCDLGMVGATAAFGTIDQSFHHGRLIGALLDNESFQKLMAERMAELFSGPMSDENMVALVHRMADQIRSETFNEQERWGTWQEGWERFVEDMAEFCDGRAKKMIDTFCARVGFTQQEKEQYFGKVG